MIFSMIKEAVTKTKDRFKEWKLLLDGDFQPPMSAPSLNFDPARDCGVYNTTGCAHIDSVLCGFKCELMDEYELSRAIKPNTTGPCGNCSKCGCPNGGRTPNT